MNSYSSNEMLLRAGSSGRAIPDNDTVGAMKAEDGSLSACNFRSLDRLRDLQGNTDELWSILRLLGGDAPPNTPPTNSTVAQPAEPSHPLFQARAIEQRLAQEVSNQRDVMAQIRALIG